MAMAAEVENGKSVEAEGAAAKKGVQFESLSPYLCIEAPRAQEAIDWYKDVFGFELVEKHYYEKRKADIDQPLLMHAHLKAGKLEIMLADAILGEEYLRPPTQLKGTTFSIAVSCNDADTVFESALNKGATVTMELKDQFWSSRYGKFTDPFGFEWAISGPLKEPPEEKPEVEDAAKAP